LARSERLRLEEPHDLTIFLTANWLLTIRRRSPYPHALDAVNMSALGSVAILSDGDAIFQPRKILRSGPMGRVRRQGVDLRPQENELRDVERRPSAAHYALIDDKSRILAGQLAWADRVTTIFPSKGTTQSRSRRETPPPSTGRIDNMANY